MGPVDCNTSGPNADFDPSLLSTILPALGKFWPNLYRDSEFYNFWKHEWCKHGTCAVTLASVDNELKYFSKGLDMQKKFDFLSILKSSNIVPSDSQTYQYTAFMNALSQGLGVEPKVSCVYEEATQTQYIAQIEVCTDKGFDIIECPKKHRHPSETLHFEPFLRAAAVAQQKGRMRRTPETCQQQPHASLVRYSQLGGCRKNEDVAYPTIKYE